MAVPDALCGPPEVPPLDRFDLYAYLGLIRVMEPETEILMQERAQREFVEDEYDSPHARAWHLSFHASQFPGEPADACKRYLTYRMMNLPGSGPMPPWVTATGTLGKAGELDIADAWYKGGRMLAVPEDPTEPDRHQLGFVEPERWLTGSTDLPILPRGWRRPYIVEIKGKPDDVVEAMLKGEEVYFQGVRKVIMRGPDIKHVRQLKATIGLGHEFDWGEVCVCERCWRILGWDHLYTLLGEPDPTGGTVPCPPAPWSDAYYYCKWCKDYCNIFFKLEPPINGEIYYWSRSWPRKTKSFYYELDRTFMANGRQVLAEARQHFLDDEIPPRPDHFQWSVGPCGQCEFKPFCRLDFGLAPRKRKPVPTMVRTMLSESNGVDHARALRPHYDPVATRELVIKEWESV